MSRDVAEDGMEDERAAKKVRLMEDEPASKTVKMSEGTAANDAVLICIVNDASNWSDLPSFHPAFTYHAFGKEEIIRGYRGLSIMLRFNARTFDCLVEVNFDERDEGADDIIALMANSLPKGFTQDKDVFLRGLADVTSKPFGSLVNAYTKDDKEFATHYAVLYEDDAAAAYFDRMQKLSLWFIEGADDIDVRDGRWSVYVLFDLSRGFLHPAGYITVFAFNAPVKQIMMQSLRICQVLVLPPYQRQGHGERLVEYIMHQARSQPIVHEVTVEDPVPGFSMLRDLVDVKTCLSHGFFGLHPSETPASPGRGTQVLKPEDIEAVKKSLKLNKTQIHRCYEVLKLRHVDRANEPEYKAYRLEVKRRLHALHAEDLGATSSADRRKGLLAKLYESLEADYDVILERCGLLPHPES
ncbi:hypothetical protein H310_09180 [Aphanomyces invadans]|uniref:Histone acetyltransferase type B catalytic subunit n=1 Tax=Aphanomyces invadans TaxID=157072 RepID=A0A024TW45_9STRA|nr:hypothetical protein H310_09180 [Aphanomyces invadans]ETV97841.1 hypothetical protein H310_09180 [Aphanomyces invadans]|eukprot:XP_008873402.1 hypothetical protein H310_09180 [Aphanomyces invadans]